MAQFATASELADRLAVEFSSEDSTRADGLLETASGLIQDAARQVIEKVTGDVLVRRGTFSDRFRLPERPVLAVTEILVDGEEIPGDTWYLEGSTLVRVADTWGNPQVEVQVTYDHGLEDDEIPAAIKAVCLEVVVRVWVNPGSVQSENYGSEATNYGREVGMLLTDKEQATVRRAMKPYGRPQAGTINLR